MDEEDFFLIARRWANDEDADLPNDIFEYRREEEERHFADRVPAAAARTIPEMEGKMEERERDEQR